MCRHCAADVLADLDLERDEETALTRADADTCLRAQLCVACMLRDRARLEARLRELRGAP